MHGIHKKTITILLLFIIACFFSYGQAQAKGLIRSAIKAGGVALATKQVIKLSGPMIKTLRVPKEKIQSLDKYRQAAEEGRLVKQKVDRSSGFRKKLEKEIGPPPGKHYDADHSVELCVGGIDCPKSNGQWLDKHLNRSAGSKIKSTIKKDPLGTRYDNVEIEND